VRGLNEGLTSVSKAPLGYGLGYGGDFGVGQTAAESSLGVMLVQIGLPGAAIWIAWIVGLALACAYAARRSEVSVVSLTLAVAIFAFLVTAVFTESAGGLLGNWPYALLPALVLSATALAKGEAEGTDQMAADRSASRAGQSAGGASEQAK